jgi:hypothetical protein
MIKNKDNDEMQEAYKLLDGEPSATAVSDAAKGEKPKTDFEDREDYHEEDLDRREGKVKGCTDIDEAYASLFESLSIILRNK